MCRVKNGRQMSRARRLERRGAATLEYVLVMGAVLPLAGVSFYYSGRILRLVYEFTCTLVTWPFL
jgi:hypothetical protein